MALSAPVPSLGHTLPRPRWLHAGLLFGAVAAGVLLTSGHAQAASFAPISTPNAAAVPAPVSAPSAADLPMAPSVLPVAPRGIPVVASPVPAVVPAVRAVEQSVSSPAVASLPDVVLPVVTETTALVHRFVALVPAGDLAVVTDALPVGSVSAVTGLAHTLVPSALGTTPALARGADGRAASSSSAPLLALAVTVPATTWPEPIAPLPPAPAPASPAPSSPAGAAGSGGAQALAAVAVDAVATAPPQASRPVRRARTDGSCAFVVSIVEWPG
jgi:hypothetical protein